MLKSLKITCNKIKRMSLCGDTCPILLDKKCPEKSKVDDLFAGKGNIMENLKNIMGGKG